jgi:hypothetical protein
VASFELVRVAETARVQAEVAVAPAQQERDSRGHRVRALADELDHRRREQVRRRSSIPSAYDAITCETSLSSPNSSGDSSGGSTCSLAS